MGKANRGSFKSGTSGNPSGKRKPRTDAVINPFSGHGTTRDRRRYTEFGITAVSDHEAITLWRSEWLARTIIEALPDDAFRRGYDIALDDKDAAEELKAIAEDLDLDAIVVRAAKLERALGGAAIMPVFEGATGDFAAPLDMARIAKVSALRVFEPRELMPASWYTDLASPNFGQPETYRLQPLHHRGAGAGLPVVHESRLAIFPGKRVSNQLQPGQRDGWGDSVLMPVRDVIADFGLGWGAAANLIADFAKGVIRKKGLMDLLASKDGREVLEHWKQSIDMTTSSLRAVLLDSEDEYTRQTTPISGLDAVLLQLAQVAAGAAEMPTTRLMGMSPAGMNATGESDTRAWYDTVARAQSTRYRRPVEWLLRLIMRSSEGPTGGIEPDVWSVQWKPLWTPSDKEQAEVRLIQAQVDAIELDRGVVTTTEVAKGRHGGDTWGPDTKVDLEERVTALMLPRVPGPEGAR